MENITVDEALALAGIREENAKTFYEEASLKVELPNAKKFLKELAKEEQEHVEMITRLHTKISGEGKIPEVRKAVKNMHNLQVDAGSVVAEDADFCEILRIAITREQGAVKEYSTLADCIEDGEAKDLFLLLLNEEKKHLRKFEEDYDDFTDEMSHKKVQELIFKLTK